MDHSSKPGGASIAVIFAFSTNGSLIMFTVKPPLLFLTLFVVSLIRAGPFEQQKDTKGGQLVTWTPGVSRHTHHCQDNDTPC